MLNDPGLYLPFRKVLIDYQCDWSATILFSLGDFIPSSVVQVPSNYNALSWRIEICFGISRWFGPSRLASTGTDLAAHARRPPAARKTPCFVLYRKVKFIRVR